MKQWAGFILLDGKIKSQEVQTTDFNKIDVPQDAIGCIMISLCDPIKFGKPLLESLEISPVTYFGERCHSYSGELKDPKGNWIKTRLGTYMEIPSTAEVIKL